MPRCPTCNSPDPARHPAVQYGGEVQVCSDAFHSRETPQNKRGDEGELIAALQRNLYLRIALARLLNAVKWLGERDGLLTYFEHDVTKNSEAQTRWQELRYYASVSPRKN